MLVGMRSLCVSCARRAAMGAYCRCLCSTHARPKPSSNDRMHPTHTGGKKRAIRDHANPEAKCASALQGAGAEGQPRATPTRAAAPEAPMERREGSTTQHASASTAAYQAASQCTVTLGKDSTGLPSPPQQQKPRAPPRLPMCSLRSLCCLVAASCALHSSGMSVAAVDCVRKALSVVIRCIHHLWLGQ